MAPLCTATFQNIAGVGWREAGLASLNQRWRILCGRALRGLDKRRQQRSARRSAMRATVSSLLRALVALAAAGAANPTGTQDAGGWCPPQR